MSYIFRYFCIVSIFLFVSSCKVKRFVKDTFPQGEGLKKYRAEVDQYKKTLRLYDYFSVRAEFNVLWLSDGMRTAYSKILSRRQGKDYVSEQSILRRQLEENDHYISFYVLSLKDINLGRNDAEWSVYLEVDDKKYQPKKVKKADLLPEYKEFFGSDFSKYKKPYVIRFDAKDWEEKQIITSETKQIKLVFCSYSSKGVIEWELGREDGAKKEETNKIKLEEEEKDLEDEDFQGTEEDVTEEEIEQEEQG